MTSSAGNATLSAADTSGVAPGRLVNGTFALPQPLRVNGATLAGRPAALRRAGGQRPGDDRASRRRSRATDALRTGTYAKTLTFTLSTTDP